MNIKLSGPAHLKIADVIKEENVIDYCEPILETNEDPLNIKDN